MTRSSRNLMDDSVTLVERRDCLHPSPVTRHSSLRVFKGRLVPILALLATGIARAAEKPFAAPQAAEHVSPTSAGSLLQVTFSLALVLAAVFAAAWLVRKLKGFSKFGGGTIQVVADVALGAKERAVLVQVGEQQLLLGVSSQQVNLLHVLPQPVSGLNPPAGTGGGDGSSSFQAGGASRPDFAAILRRSLGLK